MASVCFEKVGPLKGSEDANNIFFVNDKCEHYMLL